jgi:diaminopimelate decarboxylase
MIGFKYRGRALYCDDVSVEEIAKEVGTPFYLYSYNALIENYKMLDEAFSEVRHLICYAVKANSNLSILSALRKLGCGVDVVSEGEMFRALKAGFPPERIVFNGNGKTKGEIEFALKHDIFMFNADSVMEVQVLNELARRMGKIARISFRINPVVNPHTHPYIATALKNSKFGLHPKEALSAYDEAARCSNVEPIGIHMHIGSQIQETKPFEDGVKHLVKIWQKLKDRGITLKYLNIGGGLGIPYERGQEVATPRHLALEVIPLVKHLGCTLVLEPGRYLVGNTGVLVTTILYLKRTPYKNFVVVDGAMNDLLRPAIYGAFHEVIPVKRKEGGEIIADVVGPICESGDFLALDRKIQNLPQGSLLCILSAGAYGSVMSSNYNSRPLIPEVMVKDGKSYIIRRRQSLDQTIQNESIPDELLN